MSENATKTRGHDRTRLWTCVAYPESAPDNWRQLLDDLHIEWCESPLHEFDVNPTGEIKKPHWHLIFAFDGPKSFEQVSEICQLINAPRPERCHSLRGAARYLAHLDNPEKFQYPVDQIVPHGGFDLSAALAPTASERYALIEEMQEYCVASGIFEFADLCDYARSNRREDWFPLLCDSCAFIMREYLKSRRWKKTSEAAQAGRAHAGRAAMEKIMEINHGHDADD